MKCDLYTIHYCFGTRLRTWGLLGAARGKTAPLFVCLSPARAAHLRTAENKKFLSFSHSRALARSREREISPSIYLEANWMQHNAAALLIFHLSVLARAQKQPTGTLCWRIKWLDGCILFAHIPSWHKYFCHSKKWKRCCINTPEGGVWKPEMRKLQKKLLSWCQGVMRVHLAKRATAGCRSTFISCLASNYNCHLSTLPS
jgi:hypothetical protein